MNPLAMIDMKSKLKNNASGNINTNRNNSYKSNEGINAFTMSNLTHIENNLIKDIIQGEKKAEQVSEVNKVISLEEAVKNIRNGR